MIRTSCSALCSARSLLLSVLLLAAVSAAPAGAAPALVPAPPELNATAWVLMDATTGEILVEHNADERLPPASLTKMMTDYIVAGEIDSGRLSPNDEVLISEKAWRMGGSKMFVHVGDRVRLEDLLRGIIIQSGNDATVAVAEYVAGAEDAFAQMMNQQAELLGMENSHFVNATGWPDEDQYSSARDLAILARRLIRDFPEHYSIYSEREFTYGTDFQTGEPITQSNRNTLLWEDRTVDGVKTGHTEEAGYCLVASGVRDGMRLISVVMGTESMRARSQESQKLLRYGYRFFETHDLFAGDATLETRQVWKGAVDEVAVGIDQDVVLTLPRGSYDDLDAEMEIRSWLTAPISRGDVLGEVRVRLGDRTVYSGSLVALQDVEEAGFFKRVWHAIYLFFARLFG